MNYLPSSLSLQYTEDLLGTLQEEFGLDHDEVAKAKELLDNQLPPIVRTEILSFLFAVSYGLIHSLSTSPEKHYRVYKVPKTRGGKRQIEAPRRYLKLIQRWIHQNILIKHTLPSSVTGFVRGQNIFTNAKPHLPSKNIMIIDIKDFFPTISYKEVYKIFKNFGYPKRVATLLTRLCIFDSRLPQGAPTSPTLANLVFTPVDLALQDLAERWECVYTRYADDIAFSGNIQFSHREKKEVRGILQEFGFNINHRKSRIIGSGGRQILAGLVVNSNGLPPRYKRRQWRATYHQASLEPNKYIGKSSHLKGIASFVNEYNKDLAKEYFNIAGKVAELEH